MKLTVVLTVDEDGYWIAEIPALEGCVTYGKTREQAVKMAADAAQGWLETRREAGLPTPNSDVTVELGAVSVA